MKAITLTEPWATLVAIGAKQIETRSWPTSYRGPVAIHAAKGMTLRDQEVLAKLENGLILDTLVKHGINPHSGLAEPGFLNNHFDRCFVATCPLHRLMQATRGHVIATATLDYCGAFDDGTPQRVINRFGENELSFGDFTPGRFGFYLANVVRLPKPIPAKGQLGLWDWHPPVELRGAA